MSDTNGVIVRHKDEAPRERSTCGWRYRLISREDAGRDVSAWAHVVDIEGSREHYHRAGTELYYVLEGEGTLVCKGRDEPFRPGDVVYIPPGETHSFTAGPKAPVAFLCLIPKEGKVN